MPCPARYGRTTPFAMLTPPGNTAAVSYNRVLSGVRTRTARPCATSRTDASKHPAGGPSTRCRLNAANPSHATWRPGQPRGNTTHIGTSARQVHAVPRICGVTRLACGRVSPYVISRSSRPMLMAAIRNRTSPAGAAGPSSTKPARVHGTVTRLNTGTATTLMNGATTETRLKSRIVSGIRPHSRYTCIVTMLLMTRSLPCSIETPPAPTRRFENQRSTRTAVKESLKPGISVASGSLSTTNRQVPARMAIPSGSRANVSARASNANISIARSAGTAKPDTDA